jgi:hypothetical protein
LIIRKYRTKNILRFSRIRIEFRHTKAIIRNQCTSRNYDAIYTLAHKYVRNLKCSPFYVINVYTFDTHGENGTYFCLNFDMTFRSKIPVENRIHFLLNSVACIGKKSFLLLSTWSQGTKYRQNSETIARNAFFTSSEILIRARYRFMSNRWRKLFFFERHIKFWSKKCPDYIDSAIFDHCQGFT